MILKTTNRFGSRCRAVSGALTRFTKAADHAKRRAHGKKVRYRPHTHLGLTMNKGSRSINEKPLLNFV